MSQPLPYSGFKWLTKNKDGKFGRRKEGRGRIFEVDMEYPNHLHKLHNDYPLDPEKLSAKEEWQTLANRSVGKQKYVRLPQVSPQSHEQEKLRSPLSNPSILYRAGYESDKNT